MYKHSLERLLGRVKTPTGSNAIKLFRSGQQRPSPSIFVIMTVTWVDKVLGDDVATHLHPSDDGIETAAHLWASEAAKRT